jgi:acetyl-CoA carboxylase alpha subunit
MARSLRDTLIEALAELDAMPVDQLVAARYDRVRGYGRVKE